MAVYLNIRIGPIGFKDGVEVYFTEEQPNHEQIYSATKGEGQFLVFELIDADCSVNFHDAIRSGTFVKDLEGRFKHKLVLNAKDVPVW